MKKAGPDMRTGLIKKYRFKAIIAVFMAAVMLCLALPCRASEVYAEDESLLKERHVWFMYGYTECTGKVHAASNAGIEFEESIGSADPEYYSMYMMLCDTNHVVRVEGDGTTDGKVTFESMTPAVLDIDSEGNVTLKRTGMARIKATVAADEVYDEHTAYLDIRVDKHEGYDKSAVPHYADRPASWGLQLDTGDGSHQLVLALRPGAGVTYSSENTNVVTVDNKGIVTPVSAGTTQIWFDVDDGGGRYKACRFGWTIKITDNDPQGGQTGLTEGPVDRQVRFTYSCTDCLGEPFCLGEDQIGYYQSPSYFGVDMMLCDTDHVVRVVGDGVTADNVTLTSLTPSVLEIDNAGTVTLKKTGKAEISARVAADDNYNECTVYLGVTVDRHDGWIGTEPVHYADRSLLWGLDLDTSDGPHQLVVPLRPGASVSYSIDNPAVASVDQNGVVTPLAAGTAQIWFDVDDGGGKYKAAGFSETIKVTGETLPGEDIQPGDDTQQGSGSQTGNDTQIGDNTVTPYNKETSQKTDGDSPMDSAEGNPRKTEEKNGSTQNGDENNAQTVEDENARIAAEEAVLQAEIAKAKSLKRPTLKVKALKGKKNKLTWSKVDGADGYIVYVKYPGRKKYVKAASRDATVKSVTHKGLSKKKIYKYKVRAYKKVNGKTYYSPFSRVRKARARK